MKTSASDPRPHPFAVAVLLVLLGAPALARADEPDAATTLTAVQLTNEASDLFRAGKFAEALDRYGRAFELVHRQTIGVRMARCLVNLGRLSEAAERYLAVSRMPLSADLDPDKLAKQKEAVAQAEGEREALLPRIPGVVVQVTGPSSATVTLDGRVLPPALFGVKRTADPGAHHVEARAGSEVVSRDVTLAEGQTITVALELRSTGSGAPSPAAEGATPAATGAPPTGSSALRTAAFVGIGVGGAGVVVGLVSGLLASAKKGDLTGPCGASLVCDPKYASDVSAYNTERTVSSVGFIAGGILAAAGVTIFFTTSSRSPAPLSAFVTPTGAGVTGTF